MCVAVAGGRSRLHLIDLGSASKSRDPNNVSLSLSALGNVIMALLNGQRHVPHRLVPFVGLSLCLALVSVLVRLFVSHVGQCVCQCVSLSRSGQCACASLCFPRRSVCLSVRLFFSLLSVCLYVFVSHVGQCVCQCVSLFRSGQCACASLCYPRRSVCLSVRLFVSLRSCRMCLCVSLFPG